MCGQKWLWKKHVEKGNAEIALKSMLLGVSRHDSVLPFYLYADPVNILQKINLAKRKNLVSD